MKPKQPAVPMAPKMITGNPAKKGLPMKKTMPGKKGGRGC